MPTLGVLHEAVRAQLNDSKQTGKHLTLVCSASDLDVFIDKVQEKKPRVVVVDLGRLGLQPLSALERIRQQSAVDLTVVVYNFAKSELVAAMRMMPDVAVLKSPVSPPVLRSVMSTLIAEEISGARTSNSSTPVRYGTVDIGLRQAHSALSTLERQLDGKNVQRSIWQPSLNTARNAVVGVLHSLEGDTRKPNTDNR